MHAFKTILVVITQNHTSQLELSQAFRLASDNKARLVFAFFDQSLELMQKLQFVPLEDKLEAGLRKQLEESARTIKTLAWEQGLRAESCIIAGKPRQLILGLVNEYGADLVIKLADPSGVLARNQLTGNDLALLRKCPVPILMMACRDQLPDYTGKIMVAIDVGNPDSVTAELNQSLLLHGVYISSQEDAELHIASIWNLPASPSNINFLEDDELYQLQETTHQHYQDNLNKALNDAGIQAGKDRVTIHLLKGKPSHEIQKLANEVDVDLIVMGTLEKNAKGVLVGNTAENILNGVYCSILAVKPEGFISPLA